MPTTATMIAAGARGNTPASAARNNGSRTRFNLRRDGVEECAEHSAPPSAPPAACTACTWMTAWTCA